MRKISARERGEIESRAFLGDDVWISWKQDYDSLLSFRKNIKGKPDEETKIKLLLDKYSIEFYEKTLFHSSFLAYTDRCVCLRCDQKRKCRAPES